MEPKDFLLILTFLLGVWNIVNNYRTSRRTAFINTVTAERVKWIEKLRENISSFCGLTYTWSISELEEDGENSDRGQQIIEKLDKLRHLIRLQLNPDEQLGKRIEQLIAEIPNVTYKTQKEQLKIKLDELVKTTQSLLKFEWEKVKAEAKRGDLKENQHCLSPLLEKLNDWCLRNITQRKMFS